MINNIIVTDIERAFVVHSKKGKLVEIKNRPYFGLSLCMSGQITYNMNSKSYKSDKTKAVLLPFGGNYTLHGDKDGFFPVINFGAQNFECNEILVFELDDAAQCIREFENIRDLFLKEDTHLEIYSAFYALLNKVVSGAKGRHNPLKVVADYIENNISDTDMNNLLLSEQMGISEVYLRKLFLTQYNATPKQYILDMRIRKAKQLLTDTTFSVAKISEECGFSSVYHFCRAFKNKTALTPTEYANNHRIYYI